MYFDFPLSKNRTSSKTLLSTDFKLPIADYAKRLTSIFEREKKKMNSLSMDDLPAVRALGSLFKLTEVHLWVDDSGEMQESSCYQKFLEGDELYKKSESGNITGFSLLPEDIELAAKLNGMGLPLSFKTNKEKRNGINSGKKSGARKSNRKSPIEIDDLALDFVKVSEDTVLPASLIDSSKLTGQCEILKLGVLDVDDSSCVPLERNDAFSLMACASTSTAYNEHDSNGKASGLGYDRSLGQCSEFGNNASYEIEHTPFVDKMMPNNLCQDGETSAGCSLINESVECNGKDTVQQKDFVHLNDLVVMDLAAEVHLSEITSEATDESYKTSYTQCSELANFKMPPSHQIDDTGEWFSYWDDFHKRTYFYNVKTEESTWDPPPGMEHLVHYTVTEELTNMVDGLPGLDNCQIESKKSDKVEILSDLQSEVDLAKYCGEDNGLICQEMDEDEVAEKSDGVEALCDLQPEVDLAKYFGEDNPLYHEMDGGAEKSDEVKVFLDLQHEVDLAKYFGEDNRPFCQKMDGDAEKSDEIEALSDLQPEVGVFKYLREDNGPLCQEMNEGAGVGLSNDNANNYNTKLKKKVRRTKFNWKAGSSEDCDEVLQEISPRIIKYWCQRYLLFSRFDHGIKMDEEGWFSVTPEPLAKHHAARCGDGSVVDLFTGVGGNAIQFAQRSKHVIAIDIDPNKIEYAQHNASLYDVGDNIDFINGDSFSLAHKLKANAVFMSPPWGGPEYSKVKKFDIKTMLKPYDGQILFNSGKEIAPKIVMFLPRNVDINQLAELSLSNNPPWSLEVERNFLNGRLKGITAYFLEPSNV